MVSIKIPSQLRSETNQQDTVEVDAKTVEEAINQLILKFPSLQNKIFDENNKIRRYINIYLGDEDIRFLDFLNTKLEAEAEISLVPAIAGG